MHGLYVTHVRFFTALEDEYFEMTVLHLSLRWTEAETFQRLFLLIFGCKTEIGLNWHCFS